MAGLTADDIAYMEAHAADDKAPGFLAANIVCCAAATLAVILRAAAKRRIKGGLGWDDAMILLAWLGNLGYTIADSITVRYGMGRHIILVTDPKSLTIAVTVAECFFSCTLIFVKLSVLAFYLRIFPQRNFHIAVYVMAAVAILQNFPFIFLTILRCLPVSAQWDPVARATATCLDYHATTVVSGALNIVTDVIIVAMPLPLVLKLQTSNRKKRLIMVAFGGGAIACIVNIVRLAEYSALGSVDTTWDFIPALVTSAVELSVAIICACVPLYRPLLGRRYSYEETPDNKNETHGKPTALDLKNFGSSKKKNWDAISDQGTLSGDSGRNAAGSLYVQRDYVMTVAYQ